MLIISEKLTIGQVTFVLRVAVQILSHGGLFLLGLAVLACSPRIALHETHDVLNRTVGKSTATKTSLKWIKKRVLRRQKDPNPSTNLLIAIALSLCYGIFVSLSDIGFIGLYQCAIPGGSFKDFPASVKSEADARSLIQTNMLIGTDPNSVTSYRCGSAVDTAFGPNVTVRLCNNWHNSTYGDPTYFRQLNSTDSDVLMPKNLAPYNSTSTNYDNLSTYFVGATGDPVQQPRLEGGLAIIPHDIGVQMIVGVPVLSKYQQVVVPKTLALEVEMGCMPLGLNGQKDSNALSADGIDFFAPDASYQASRMKGYTGPDHLRDILAQTADEIRDVMRPLFNASNPDPNGYLPGINGSYSTFSWQTKIEQWSPLGTDETINDLLKFALGNCTDQVHQTMNVTTPAASVKGPPSACVVYQLRGSTFIQQEAFQFHGETVCATTSQVNMVSATINVDGDDQLAANLTRLPSDLYVAEASYFDVIYNALTNETIFVDFDPIRRFTLSDNPNGKLEHFIYQEDALSATAWDMNHGPGSMGKVLSVVGGSMVGVTSGDDGTLGLLNAKYFSLTNFTTAAVTKWGGGVGASFLRGSLAYNPWSALDREALTLVSTGGQAAACYKYPYGFAFLPLILAALFIVSWTIVMYIASRINGTGRLEVMYGGLSPTIISPASGKLPPDAVLVWENESQPVLKAIEYGAPIEVGESQALVSYMRNDEGDHSEKSC